MYPLRLGALPEATQAGITDICGSALTSDYATEFPPSSKEVVVSTPAVHTQAYLGSCDLLEPYMRERRTIDLDTRRAAAERARADALQQTEEVKRLQARLSQVPPMLESPFATPLLAESVSDDAFGVGQ